MSKAIKSTSKAHGMSSEKASRIKKRGHNKENLFAALINGEVIKGTKKSDVQDKNGINYSVKGGSEVQKKEGREGRWQIFMYKKSRFIKESDFPSCNKFISILDKHPEYEEYLKNKKNVKQSYVPIIIELANELKNIPHCINFFERAFFDKTIDYLVIYDDEVFIIVDKIEFWETILKNVEITTNKTNYKVVFRTDVLLGEIEVRTTNDGKYPAIMFTMRKRAVMNLLFDKIKNRKNVHTNIMLLGKSINTFDSSIL